MAADVRVATKGSRSYFYPGRRKRRGHQIRLFRRERWRVSQWKSVSQLSAESAARKAPSHLIHSLPLHLLPNPHRIADHSVRRRAIHSRDLPVCANAVADGFPPSIAGYRPRGRICPGRTMIVLHGPSSRFAPTVHAPLNRCRNQRCLQFGCSHATSRFARCSPAAV